MSLARLSALTAACLFTATAASAVSYNFRPLALTGQTAPGTGGATFTSFVSLGFSHSGTAAITARIAGPDVEPETSDVLYRAGGGGLELAVRGGEAAPGAGGGAFLLLGDRPGINGGGDLAFHAALLPSGVGVYKSQGGAFAEVARGGGVAPGTGGATFRDDIPSFGSPAIDDAGDTAFTAGLTGAGVDVSNGTALFREDGGALRVVARAGEVAPDTGGARFHPASFDTTLVPSLSRGGDLAFHAFLDGRTANPFEDSAIFLEQAGTLRKVLRSGDASPITGREVSFLGAPALDDTGGLAFAACLVASGGSDPDCGDQALFVGSESALRIVARTGQHAPGGGGAFRVFTAVALNSDGDAAFVALDDGAPGAFGQGLYADVDGALSLVVRAGQTIRFGAGDTRTIESFGGLGVGPSFIDDRGRILFHASFTDFSSGVIVAAPIPLPSSILLLPSGLALLGLMARRRSTHRL